MRIILVVANNIYGRRLAAELFWERHAVDYVLYETQRAPLSFWWKKLRRVGLINFGFQVWLDRWYKRQALKYWNNDRYRCGMSIKNINGYPLFEPDDVVIGFGTSYIKPSTIKKVRAFLNLHTGVLPKYRGVKSEFWALKNGDRSGIGWTLHYMVSKLDAGGIVYLSSGGLWHKNPAILRCIIIKKAIPTLKMILAKFRKSGVPVGEPQGKGHYYTTPTWKEWREYRRRP